MDTTNNIEEIKEFNEALEELARVVVRVNESSQALLAKLQEITN